MSWDLFVFNAPPEMENLDNVEPDHELAPIGLRKDIVARILEAAPETDFTKDGSWGTLAGDNWTGLRAFDVGSNAFFKRPQALASFQAWGAFRDGMAARIQGEPD